ncbi:MAG: T9SS type A sorting domain-containing protein [Bacteroidota bacterium]
MRIALVLLFISELAFSQVEFDNRVVVDQTGLANQVESVYTADLDGDGDLDLISASRADNKIAWYENLDGNGTYGPQTVLSTDAENAVTVYAGDIDGDGDMDVLSGSFDDEKIAWYENIDGQGNFSEEIIISQDANAVFGVNSLYAVDMDGDDDLDVLASSFFDNKISWIENLDGQGSFGPAQSITTGLTFALFAFPADLDNDGDMDVIGVSASDDNVIWYENVLGGAVFNSNLVTGALSRPQRAYASDLDGDGDMDILTSSSNDDRISWYENTDGQGDFNLKETISTSVNGAVSIRAADLDNDGDQDVVCTSDFDDEIVWFENTNGQGDFGFEQIITTDILAVEDIHLADPDGDGDIDIFSTSSLDDQIAWYENTDGMGSFDNLNIVTQSAENPQSILAVDIDGDGDLDALGASFDDDRIAWYENIDGQANLWQQQTITNTAFDARFAFAQDLDGDNDLDVLAAFEDEIAWYENVDGAGNFSAAQTVTTLTDDPNIVLAADIDGDGDQDVISASSLTDRIAWHENLNGQGNFGTLQLLNVEVSSINEIVIRDLDGDGDLDIAYTDSFGDKVAWHRNLDGQGVFSDEQIISTSFDAPGSIAAADVDQDDDLDLVVSIGNENRVVWLENVDGLGNFTIEHLVTETMDVPSSLSVFDIDGDDDLDVVVSDISTDEVLYFENIDGNGVFGVAQFISNAVNGKVTLSAADLDNDGDIDLLSAASINDQINCHINQSPTTNEIFGQVVLDLDNDGCDNDDLPISDVMVTTEGSDEQLATFTISNGVYQLFPGEGSYETSLMITDFFTSEPMVQNSTFDDIGAMDNVDFCLTATQDIVDLTVSLYPLTEARPGFDAEYQLVFQNNGTETISDVLSLEYDEAKLDFLNSSVPVSSQTANELSFDFTALNPFEIRTIDLSFNVLAPPIVEIDEILDFTATIQPLSSDANDIDNQFELEQIVIGSFDPNDIRVLEGATILEEQVAAYLHYIVRFQNTGTASAINVRIENVLDPNLDWTTLQMESSSHPNRVEVRDGNLVTFFFDNINLPDSTSNEPESNGFVAYRIKPLADLTIGDVIQNKADIFFDFNLPIETNTVSTEVVEPVSTDKIPTGLAFSVSPNPVADLLTIHTEAPIQRVNIYDGLGRLVHTQVASNTIQLASHQAGVYLCQVIAKNGEVGLKKIVKSRAGR